MIDIPLNAAVECGDGHCGRSTCVIINPATQEVTHFVVKEKRLPHAERLVRVDRVGYTTADLIRLRCTKDELAKFEPFTATQFIRSQRPRYLDGSYATWPYVVPETMIVPVKHKRIPPAELAVRRGTHVKATDGGVGRVDEFLVEPSDGHITHVVLREGHLWGQKDVTIPVSQIDHVLGDTVSLKLDKEAIQSLPAIAVRRRYVCDEARDGELELILVAFSEEGAANQALQALKDLYMEGVLEILNAAVLTKDREGKPSLEEIGDVDAKHGALFGAIAGYVIGGLLAGPPGVVVGTVAGAVTGAVAAHEIDMGFSDEFLEETQEALQAGSSAMLVLVEHKWAERVVDALARFRGRLFRHVLREEIAAHLTGAAETETSGNSSGDARS